MIATKSRYIEGVIEQVCQLTLVRAKRLYNFNLGKKKPTTESSV